jgi:hypothetical protein
LVQIDFGDGGNPLHFFEPELIDGAGSFSSKSMNIGLRIGEPAPRRAEWIFFF